MKVAIGFSDDTVTSAFRRGASSAGYTPIHGITPTIKESPVPFGVELLQL